MKCFRIWLVGSVLAAQIVSAQGFINLDFESAKLPPLAPGQHGGGYVPIDDAVPGWTCAIDGIPVTQALNNNGTTGAPSLSVWGERAIFVGGVLQGGYTVILSGGFGGDSGHTTSLSQTSLIPLSARSLLFKAAPYEQATPGEPGPGEGLFSVLIGGRNLDYYILSTEANYKLYGAAIPSEFVGTVQPLTFIDASLAGTWHYEKLDDIQFSSEPIPEPRVMSLVVVSVVWIRLGSRRTIITPIEAPCSSDPGPDR